MKELKCKHYDGDGYAHMLSDDEELNLCTQCHLNLAGEIAKQQAIETFGTFHPLPPRIYPKKLSSSKYGGLSPKAAAVLRNQIHSRYKKQKKKKDRSFWEKFFD